MQALIDRLANEPVLVLGAVLAVLTAIQSAMTDGLSPVNLLIAVLIAGISFLTRELTVPLRKVEQTGEWEPVEDWGSPGDPFIPGDQGE